METIVAALIVREDYSGTFSHGWFTDFFVYMGADARATYPPGEYGLNEEEAYRIVIDGNGRLDLE